VRHFRIALYDVTSGTAEETIDIARGAIPIFEAQPGFVRYEFGALRDGGIMSFSVWDTEDEARHAEEVAAEYTREHLANRMKERQRHFGDLAWDEAR
jgi:heme-degrading monooxygenase HmoA